jgi:murein DD-endopeptidase MepM/ murein hydrolase activator NlpD
MRSPRYTILIANRNSGAVRRLAVSRRALVSCAGILVSLPILAALALVGLGAAQQAEHEALSAANETLELENASYRAATGELASQISSLQLALSELGQQAELDPATRAALERLPAVVKSRSAGGGGMAVVPVSRPARSTGSPESTFGALRDLLGSLENSLATVRSTVEHQQALARSTPSMWPIVGYLSSLFGPRRDPFTGGPDYHAGLDISADRGTPVRATADGTVDQASYYGNYGQSILLRHGFGISTRFGHLSGYAVRVGQKVKRGDIIGYVGATGRATSSHLHYEILINDQPINPLRLLTRP